MKRVLYFIPEFPRLTETFIEREVTKLAVNQKIDIKVLSLQRASGAMSKYAEQIVDYRRLDFVNFVLGLLYLVTRFSACIEALKIVLQDPTKSKPKNFYLFIKALGYTHIIASYKPEHLHAHFLSDPSTIVMIASKVLGLPYSISAHARDVFVDGTLIKDKVLSAKFVSLCNGYAWKKCIEISGLTNPENVHLIYHGMDLDSTLSAPSKIKKSERPMIFYVGRLVEKKGLKYLVEASKLLKDRGVAHEVYMGGAGPLYQELLDMIKNLGLEKNVFILGGGNGIQNAEAMEYFKVVDILAHPSIVTDAGDADGVPTTVIEAAMAKLPIVATEAGSITDLLNIDTGVLVPQKNSYELANALEKLIYDPDLRNRLGTNAYKKAKEMFSLEKNVGELESLFLKKW